MGKMPTNWLGKSSELKLHCFCLFDTYSMPKNMCSDTCTANIFKVIFTVFNCVRLSTVVSLYGLHLIAAPSTIK